MILPLLLFTSILAFVGVVTEIVSLIRGQDTFSKKTLIISAILLAISLPCTIFVYNRFRDSQEGNEVARYTQSEYDIDKIFLEYYIRQSLHEGGFYYKFKIEFDAIDEEYLEIRKGYDEYDDHINIIYHKYPQENSFLDPFNLENYKR